MFQAENKTIVHQFGNRVFCGAGGWWSWVGGWFAVQLVVFGNPSETSCGAAFVAVERFLAPPRQHAGFGREPSEHRQAN